MVFGGLLVHVRDGDLGGAFGGLKDGDHERAWLRTPGVRIVAGVVNERASGQCDIVFSKRAGDEIGRRQGRKEVKE